MRSSWPNAGLTSPSTLLIPRIACMPWIPTTIPSKSSTSASRPKCAPSGTRSSRKWRFTPRMRRMATTRSDSRNPQFVSTW
ncbi:hypothetical protein ANCDUO_21017 [Ancylostoma duodenale]|uniref:Uncharacterized protein n=1 Tax=Ancylostoma duodenale TaxID=51022 RepID=A0A0C2FK13_9BILA|nr:hypothetical protein ANCDUO_21017 [Ancylostoma duodenale]